MANEVFDKFAQLLKQQGIDQALEHLIDHYRAEKQHYELFEFLKMRARHRLDLPLLYHDLGDDLSAEKRDQLEEALVGACREVGLLMLDDGRIREGWHYLRPVGDNAPVIKALHEAKVDEDNVQDLIDVALGEGVDPAFGFGLTLEHYGTCNAVTTFEQQLVMLPPAKQQPMAEQLLRHLYDELTATVKGDAAHQEGKEPAESTLAGILESRDYLVVAGSYHIDTSHLAATVRFAKVLEDPELLQLAWELTEYGRRLDAAFQMPQEPPFEEFYPSHARYFQLLLSNDVEGNLNYFREKAEASDIRREGSLAIETYITLLARIGRDSEAMDAALNLIPPGVHTMGIAPPLFELCQRSGQYQTLAESCRARNDLLGYATTLLHEQVK
ncbi:MAG: hypothetical protein WD045_14325 [Pirellulaceae bacterium]